MPLSAVIVDDEQLARDELAFLLKDVGDVDVVAQGKNGVEGVNLVRITPTWSFSTCKCPVSTASASSRSCSTRKSSCPRSSLPPPSTSMR